jgi:hypothetical protein
VLASARIKFNKDGTGAVSIRGRETARATKNSQGAKLIATDARVFDHGCRLANQFTEAMVGRCFGCVLPLKKKNKNPLPYLFANSIT